MARYRLVDQFGQVTTPLASYARIATHLLADWRPWRPPHYAAGLLGLVHGNAVHKSGRWLAAREGAEYEKQWKSMASWAFGTAFCRDALDRLGYGAVVPVSVLTGAHPIHMQPGSRWSPLLAAFPYLIRVTRPPPDKGLMPDLLAIHGTNSTLAFAEAKGTRHLLSGTIVAGKLTDSWCPQVANADAIVGGRREAAHRFVVATRLNPFAKGQPRREIEVRVFVPPTGFSSRLGTDDAGDPIVVADSDPEPVVPMRTALNLFNLAGLIGGFGLPSAASVVLGVGAASLAEQEEAVREELRERVLRGRREALIPRAQHELGRLRDRAESRRVAEQEVRLFSLGSFSVGEMPRVKVGLDETALRLLDTAVQFAGQADGTFGEMGLLAAAPDRARLREAAEEEESEEATGEDEREEFYLRSDGVVGWTDQER